MEEQELEDVSRDMIRLLSEFFTARGVEPRDALLILAVATEGLKEAIEKAEDEDRH